MSVMCLPPPPLRRSHLPALAAPEALALVAMPTLGVPAAAAAAHPFLALAAAGQGGWWGKAGRCQQLAGACC